MKAEERDVRQMVLDEVQGAFPLERDPYQAIAEHIGVERARVLSVVDGLRADGTIRRIGGSFSSRRLGFSSTLCALRTAGGEDEVERVAAIVSGHREVTHNYLRDGDYNLWFTIIAPSKADIARVLDAIVEETGCADVLNLPAKQMFKINADFSGKSHSHVERESAKPFRLHDPFDIALVRWAQGDVAGERPFATAGLDEDRVIGRLREWRADGALRRFGAIVRHRAIGFAFNGMTVWNVPERDVERVGAAFAGFPFVSHCYERPAVEGWRFNLYAMAHAKTQEELDAHLGDMRAASGLDCEVLLSRREFKKTSPVYFD